MPKHTIKRQFIGTLATATLLRAGSALSDVDRVMSPIPVRGRPRKNPGHVSMVECSCGWQGEIHVWAYHLNLEIATEAREEGSENG